MKIDSVSNTSSIRNINQKEALLNHSSDITNKLERKQHENSYGNEILSEKTIREAIENTNKKLVTTEKKFEFSINEETNDVIVKVINKETDDVIREIPSEKILDMVAKMMELAGLFIDEKR